uniref:PEGA domain-containing protein n=1 Tax=candidate division WOR-3 bacterium TaxID=2052148 RepID=A0A7V6CMP3_UNCW3
MIIADKYEIIKLIKRGINTAVYLAKQRGLERLVILKTLELKEDEKEEWLLRFEREAKILANLENENIVKIYDYGVFDTKYYLVYEYVKGKSLAEILNDKKRLTFIYALYLFYEVAKILKTINEKNIIHRDIKPANILIREDGLIKIGDFGLAYVKEEKDLTIPGTIIGTPAYMAPEQCLGKEISEQVDIYAWGISFLETLSGINPFYSESYPATINKILAKEEIKLKGILKDIDNDFLKIIRKATYKKKERRYKNFSLLISDIEAYLKKKAIVLPTKKEFADYLFEKETVEKMEERKRKKLNLKVWLPLPLILIAFFTFLIFSNLFKPHKKVATFILPDTLKPATPFKETVVKKIEVKKNQTPILSKKEEKEFGYLFINCEPWGKVYLDNQYLFTTPTKEFFKLIPKSYRLKISNDFWGELETTINIKAKESLFLFFDLKKLKSYLKINVIPWGEVYLDDKYLGQTPIVEKIPVEPGIRVLKVINPYYQFYYETIAFKKGETIERIIKLK